MPTRRDLFRLVMPILLCGPPLSRALGQASPDWAAVFVRRLGNDIAGIIATPGSIDERRQRLQRFIDGVVDVEAVARFCLGRFWRQASSVQQRDYVTLFHAVLMKIVLARIGDDTQKQGEVAVTVDQPELRQDGVYVPTTVAFSGNIPLRVTWVVSDDAKSPRIIDVMAEGTSLRITLRNDYSSFIGHHDNNIDALIEALRKQACDDCKPPSAPGTR